MNPRVKVVVDQEDIAQKPDSYFSQFNVVCLTGCTTEQMVKDGRGCFALLDLGFDPC